MSVAAKILYFKLVLLSLRKIIKCRLAPLRPVPRRGPRIFT